LFLNSLTERDPLITVLPNILKIDNDIQKLENKIQKYYNKFPEKTKNENIIINSEINNQTGDDVIMTSDNVIVS
jgi:hypothetical protein